jgi:hypothetical protein
VTGAVRRGPVEWTGDNPFIYLSDEPRGMWSSLTLFFRIAQSRSGPGHMAIIVDQPAAPALSPMSVCLTDNAPLADYLIRDFVRRFPLFRPIAPEAMPPVLADAAFRVDELSADGYAVSAESPSTRRSLALRWASLSKPFAVVLAPEQSATGEHEMFSVFQLSSAPSVQVDGNVLPGQPIQRTFLEHEGPSAALALSETWVRAS